MPKKIDKVKLLEQAEKLGFSVPPQMKIETELKQWEENGIVEAWACAKCKSQYQSEIKLLEVTCDCGHEMKKFWEAKLPEL